jgi:hypothetical protein
MFAIVNARGVPGSAGAVVRLAEHGLCLLTCHHVLFGRGAGAGDPVWIADERKEKRRMAEAGHTVGGFIGRVTHEGEACFIDCAVAALHDTSRLPSLVLEAISDSSRFAKLDRAAVGMKVRKSGWITGVTEGVVADTAHYDTPFIEERAFSAPGQILVRPVNPEQCFSAFGESGAAVVDEADRIVGFLWGLNPSGEGVAFPALPALRHLGASLHTLPRHDSLLAWEAPR